MKNFIAFLSIILLNCSALLALDDIIESHLERLLTREDDGVALMKLLAYCDERNPEFDKTITDVVAKLSQRNLDFLIENKKLGPAKKDKFIFRAYFEAQSGLEDLSFKDGFLVGCIIWGKIVLCSFERCTFLATNFEDANLQSVNFYEAKLRGAKWKNTQVENGFFLDAQLVQNDFTNCLLNSCCFNRGHCKAATFRDSSFISCEFLHANLSQASFDDCDWNTVDLSESVLHEIHLGPQKNMVKVMVDGAKFNSWREYYGFVRVTLESIQHYGLEFDENNPPSL
jgi:uncharacterized protein YjbI with pentapeptide repeats